MMVIYYYYATRDPLLAAGRCVRCLDGDRGAHGRVYSELDFAYYLCLLSAKKPRWSSWEEEAKKKAKAVSLILFS